MELWLAAREEKKEFLGVPLVWACTGPRSSIVFLIWS
jgi:hypothetical protein